MKAYCTLWIFEFTSLHILENKLLEKQIFYSFYDTTSVKSFSFSYVWWDLRPYFPFSRKRIFGGTELAEGNSDFLLQHPVSYSAHVDRFCYVVMGYLFLWSSISSQKYEQELFKLALPCLSAVAGALPPDYMESNYVSMMEKQSSMDSEGNFNPQPVDTSKYGLFLLQQIFIVNDVWSLKLNKVLKWTFSHPCPLWIGILLIGVPLRDEMIVVIIMVTWIPEIDKMYLLRDILLTSPGFSVCNHMVISIIMRIKKGYQLSF